jgi:glycosyltransferase involved in cell wall biosynthesis
VRILIDYRPALRARSGVGEYVDATVRALAATPAPDESLVIFSSSLKDRLPDGTIPEVTVVDRRVPVRTLNFAWHRLAWPPVEWLAGRVDVVQGMHPLLIPAQGAARLVTIHDLHFLDDPEATSREIRRDYVPLTARHAQEADQVVVVSTHTAEAVEHRLGVPPARITICPPGAPDWVAREREPEHGGCLLFIGTIEPRKNVDGLLEAYARLLASRPDAPPLVLAGRLTSAAGSIAARVRQPPFAGHVDLPGYVSDADKRALFDRALVLVLPSETEGFGMPAVEAMTAGVPVIAARRGALPEVVGGAGRLIDPGDPAELAAALEDILDSAALRARMAVAGREQARRFSWRETAARMREAWDLARMHRAGRA